MRIHREGYRFLTAAFLVLTFLMVAIHRNPGSAHIFWTGVMISLVFFIFLLAFFRVPRRSANAQSGQVVCPADGKVVVIERVFEDEYLKRDCIQVSIFMSPLNVHVNWAPVGGKITYYKYHPGKFLVAWHPKSSTLNERTSMVFETDGFQILMRQIAGFVARRIVCYAEEGAEFKQGEQIGFIKFGSRVDVFLPLDFEIKVKIGQKVSALNTILAVQNSARQIET